MHPLKIRHGSGWKIVNAPQGADGIGVPAGGSAGQNIVKQSGNDYDVSWGTPSGNGINGLHGALFRSGGYVTNRMTAEIDDSTGPRAANVIEICPFVPMKTFVCNAIGGYNFVTSGPNAVFGIYEESNGFLSGDPIFYRAGSMNGAAGLYTWSVDPGVTIEAGNRYWLASCFSATTGSVCYVPARSMPVLSGAPNSLASYVTYRFSRTYDGTLPNAEAAGFAPFNSAYLSGTSMALVYLGVQ